MREDLDSPRHLAQYKATKDAEDLPGLGKHYCVECAKWFESEYNMVSHTKGKNHKRRYGSRNPAANLRRMRIQTDGRGSLNYRLRLLREDPHTQKAAEAAVGLGTDNGKRPQESEIAMEE